LPPIENPPLITLPELECGEGVVLDADALLRVVSGGVVPRDCWLPKADTGPCPPRGVGAGLLCPI